MYIYMADIHNIVDNHVYSTHDLIRTPTIELYITCCDVQQQEKNINLHIRDLNLCDDGLNNIASWNVELFEQCAVIEHSPQVQHGHPARVHAVQFVEPSL